MISRLVYLGIDSIAVESVLLAIDYAIACLKEQSITSVNPGSIVCTAITNNLPSGSPLWHPSCAPFLGIYNVHCHVRWNICIYGCDSTVGFRISSPSDWDLSIE